MRHGESERGHSDLHPKDHVDQMRPERSPEGGSPPADTGPPVGAGGAPGTAGTGAAAAPRTGTTSIGPGTVVVGIDGSAVSRAALRWALDHAGGPGRQVVAVTAWRSPVQTHPRGARTRTDTEQDSRAQAEAAVRQEAPDVPVIVGRGRPAEVLAEISRGAGLLVVGNDRPARLAAPASTVLDCLRLAEVPVVVVPSEGHA
ncbi:universal stress protein [Pseudonocardia sp. C8]|uniref:universal stress protein n=1 Tax=Pseudonocardia sp. C8 TaxID=2762759 RepID=UPI001643513F|nr:universal stress protein [Pseudonocardia sp. C8]MBC3192480.1 universal stress protein [Pseudonocardia sp. C8]